MVVHVCVYVCVMLRKGKQNTFHSNDLKEKITNPDKRCYVFDSQFFWKLPSCPCIRKSFWRINIHC